MIDPNPTTYTGTCRACGQTHEYAFKRGTGGTQYFMHTSNPQKQPKWTTLVLQTASPSDVGIELIVDRVRTVGETPCANAATAKNVGFPEDAK